MPDGEGVPAGALVSVRCPQCGTTVYSPQLGRDELLRRHQQYCAGAEPEDQDRS